MSAAPVQDVEHRLDIVDAAIVVTRDVQLEARRRWARSPNVQNQLAEERITSTLDGLLERRFELHPVHPDR